MPRTVGRSLPLRLVLIIVYLCNSSLLLFVPCPLANRHRRLTHHHRHVRGRIHQVNHGRLGRALLVAMLRGDRVLPRCNFPVFFYPARPPAILTATLWLPLSVGI